MKYRYLLPLFSLLIANQASAYVPNTLEWPEERQPIPIHLHDSAVDEIRNHTIHRTAITFDHDSGLPRSDELCVDALRCESLRELNRRDHLSDATIVSDGMDPKAVFVQTIRVRNVTLGILADID